MKALGVVLVVVLFALGCAEKKPLMPDPDQSGSLMGGDGGAPPVESGDAAAPAP